MNKITEMMGRMTRGLKGKPDLKIGPIGEAILIVKDAVKQSKERGMFSGSPTLKSMEILVDHTEKCRLALLCGVKLVDLLEDQGEWSPEKSKEVTKAIAAYKLACVGAKLDQKFPS